MTAIELSIVAPANDEEGNIPGLVDDVHRALENTGLRFEMIIVDDASVDGTKIAVAREISRRPWLRGFTLAPLRGRPNGQSAAFEVGIAASQGEFVALMDADRQNDPSDLPAMLEVFKRCSVDVVQGNRSSSRQDHPVKVVTSWVGRTFRRLLLGDTIVDTGCSLRILRREVALLLPLRFRGMHRFIPYYARMLGYEVIEIPVRHRARIAGVTKYGIRDRALAGLQDLMAVRWMRNRLRDPHVETIGALPEYRTTAVETKSFRL